MSPQEILAFWKLAENQCCGSLVEFFVVIVLFILNYTIVRGETVRLHGGGVKPDFQAMLVKSR